MDDGDKPLVHLSPGLIVGAQQESVVVFGRDLEVSSHVAWKRSENTSGAGAPLPPVEVDGGILPGEA